MTTHRPPPAATSGQGRRDGLLVAAGLGSRDARASPPRPPGLHHRGRRAHTRAHGPAPDAGLAGPSPDSEGGGAGRGKQRAALGPTAGPARARPPAKARDSCPRALAVALVATARLGGAAAGGSGTPRLPSRIAREGFLTEGASSPTHRLSPFGPAEALHEPPPSPRLGGVGWGWGGLRYGEAHGPKGRPRPQPGGTTSAVPPPGLSMGLRKEGARPRSATETPPSHRGPRAQHDRTHARVPCPGHTQSPRSTRRARTTATRRHLSRPPTGGERETGTHTTTPPLDRLDPPAESHSRDTPPRRGPEEHAGKRERHHRSASGT